MDFNLIVSTQVQAEIENALEYYTEINFNLATKFYAALNESYNKLKINPFFQKRHKDYRGIKLYKFPFLLFYIVDEENKTDQNTFLFSHLKKFKKISKIVEKL